MTFDPHQRARFLIDETSVQGITPQDALWLRSHTVACTGCASYQETAEGIVRGLKAFAFDCDPNMAARMPIVAARPATRRRPSLAWGWALAVAALLIIGIAPFYRDVRDERQEKADALLIDGVESRVNRLVPIAMEPLVQSQPVESQ
jgi:hypothetical protein